jgi:ribosomal protein L44E
MSTRTLRNTLAAVLLGVFGATGGAAFADAPKVPQTVADHMALAKSYQEKAAANRKEAKEHREMAEAARQSAANAQAKRGQPNPQIQKMEKHCDAIATAAEKLAIENEKAADYHTLRAKELQGK